jgi:hypothetical protein
MSISKKKLLSLIKENLKEMAMDFETPDRPDQGVQDKLAQKDTPFKKVPLPSTGDEPNKNFQEVLASERYKQVVANLRRYLGDRAPIQQGMSGVLQLQLTLMNAHNTIVQIESQHKQQLEQLAVELVMKEMGIPEGAIEYDAKLVGMGEIDMGDFNNDDNNEENSEEVNIENEVEIFNELQNLDLEKAKRRMINAIIQGASKKGHYMFHLVPERLEQITGHPNILNLYGTMMSINDLNYWQISDDLIKGLSGSAAGKESVERPEDEEGTAKVVARGINFPVLVHELIKGTLEVFAIQGRPEGDEGFEDVESTEDTLEKEMWDLRLGPAIWDRIRSQFPEDILTDENKIELQNYLLVEIFKLPAKKFLTLMKEVLGKTNRGKQLINQLMDGIQKMFNDQDYEDSISQFRSNLDDAEEEITDDELSDLLGGLNIRPSNSKNDDDDLDDFLSRFGMRRPDEE